MIDNFTYDAQSTKDLARMKDCYRNQYGDETEALFNAMAVPQEKIALLNQFTAQEERIISIQQSLAYGSQFAKLSQNTLPQMKTGLMSHYFLDLSSIFAPLVLPITPSARVLDMCAAPGGKLLVMLSRVIPDVTFIANDLSRARAQRLRRVIKDYVPHETANRFIKIANIDAINFALREPASFDAVLLDVPCSSEAHVVRDQKLLRKFTGLRKSLPQRQFALLSAALLAVKPGGHVMYSTCSINSDENEGVIKKALVRKKMPCELIQLTPFFGMSSDFGVTILPHLHGAGPAFFSLLRRI